jgi:hypothetical protein
MEVEVEVFREKKSEVEVEVEFFAEIPSGSGSWKFLKSVFLMKCPLTK